MKAKAKLIALEGPDGSGKSTIAKYLVDKLTSLDIPVRHTRETGGTPIGNELRNICYNKRSDEKLSSVARLLLVYAARIQNIDEVIEPALDSGINVVTDRFNISTMVYDGILGKQAALMGQIEEYLVTRLPDVVIYLDVNPTIAAERMRTRGKADNNLYKGSLEKAQQIHNAYRTVITIWKSNDVYKGRPVFTVDANQDEAHVKNQIDLIINAIFNLDGARPLTDEELKVYYSDPANALEALNESIALNERADAIESLLHTRSVASVNYITVISLVDNDLWDQRN